jgi:hypothetical protein
VPRFDGTGPSGEGPITGRGHGVCGRLFGKGQTAVGLRSVFGMLTIAVSGIVIRDLANPHGIIRPITGGISRRIASGFVRPQIVDAVSATQPAITDISDNT